MSHSALYIYGSDGEMKRFKEFKNSWGMGPRVWNPLSEKHLAKLFKDGESPVFLEEWERLINRRNDLDLAWFELNVLEALLDMAVLRREGFELLSKSIRAFVEAYPAPGRVSHLEAVAETLDALAKEPEVLGIGFMGTSISGSPWIVRIEDPEEGEDEEEPYNINVDEQHFFVEMRPAA